MLKEQGLNSLELRDADGKAIRRRAINLATAMQYQPLRSELPPPAECPICLHLRTEADCRNCTLHGVCWGCRPKVDAHSRKNNVALRQQRCPVRCEESEDWVKPGSHSAHPVAENALILRLIPDRVVVHLVQFLLARQSPVRGELSVGHIDIGRDRDPLGRRHGDAFHGLYDRFPKTVKEALQRAHVGEITAIRSTDGRWRGKQRCGLPGGSWDGSVFLQCPTPDHARLLWAELSQYRDHGVPSTHESPPSPADPRWQRLDIRLERQQVFEQIANQLQVSSDRPSYTMPNGTGEDPSVVCYGYASVTFECGQNQDRRNRCQLSLGRHRKGCPSYSPGPVVAPAVPRPTDWAVDIANEFWGQDQDGRTAFKVYGDVITVWDGCHAQPTLARLMLEMARATCTPLLFRGYSAREVVQRATAGVVCAMHDLVATDNGDPPPLMNLNWQSPGDPSLRPFQPWRKETDARDGISARKALQAMVDTAGITRDKEQDEPHLFTWEDYGYFQGDQASKHPTGVPLRQLWAFVVANAIEVWLLPAEIVTQVQVEVERASQEEHEQLLHPRDPARTQDREGAIEQHLQSARRNLEFELLYAKYQWAAYKLQLPSSSAGESTPAILVLELAGAPWYRTRTCCVDAPERCLGVDWAANVFGVYNPRVLRHATPRMRELSANPFYSFGVQVRSADKPYHAPYRYEGVASPRQQENWVQFEDCSVDHHMVESVTVYRTKRVFRRPDDIGAHEARENLWRTYCGRPPKWSDYLIDGGCIVDGGY